MLTVTITPRALKYRHGYLLFGLLLLSSALVAGPSARIGGGASSFSSPPRSAASSSGKSYSAPTSSVKRAAAPVSSTRSSRLGAGESVGLQRESSTYDVPVSTMPKSAAKPAAKAATGATTSTFPVGAVVAGAAIGYMASKNGKESPPQSTTGGGTNYPYGSTSTVPGMQNLSEKAASMPANSPASLASHAPELTATDPDLKTTSTASAATPGADQSFVLLWIALIAALLVPLIVFWRRKGPEPAAVSLGATQRPFRGDFTVRATVLFDVLQRAHQQGDAQQLRQHLTTHCYEQLYGKKPPLRRDVRVQRGHGQLFAWTPEHMPPLASIRFRGEVFEDAGHAANPFLEDWHFSWQEGDWKLAGITQVNEA